MSKLTSYVPSSREEDRLDAMRAAAILCVLACHSSLFYKSLHTGWDYALGILGVELFFVLSGYLICHVLLAQIVKENNTVSFRLIRTFWLRRWFRTLPNYYFFLVLFCVVFHFCGWSLLRYVSFTQNLFHQVPQFFSISWSLAVKEWFYLLFPGLILLFKAMRWRNRYAFMMAASILFIGPLFLRFTWGAGYPWESVIRKIAILRLDALMWGVFLAITERYLPVLFRFLQNPWIFLGGLALLLGSSIGIGFRFTAATEDFYSTHADSFWFCGFDGGAALILPCCVALQKFPSALKPMIYYTSLWSYSIYLSHPLIIILVNRHFGKIASGEEALISLAFIFGISALIYTYFEAPVLRLRDRSKKNAA